ncbi:MAG TPA: pyridoxamine 5'-phosphate oxidase family protein [Coriobacteriia bacterium]|nr:pyridoxamine 5'-phosphate oxidase family protein [Coriobacteriia bacterium]
MSYHPMRRHDREITDPEIADEILRSGRFATIALAGPDPYLVTMSCGYDPELRRLCFHVAKEGRKLERVAADPRGCATVIQDLGYKHGECAHPFRSVVAFGRLRVVEEPSDARRAMRTLLEQLEGDQGAWEAMGLDDDSRFGRFAVLVFEIDSVSAKEGE